MFDNTTTPQSIQQGILKTLSPAFNTMEGGYTNTLTGGTALEIWKVWEGMRLAEGCICITKDSPKEIILGKCADYGIAPKEGTRATAVLTISGNDGVTIVKGKRFLTASGLEYAAIADAVIANGSVQAIVEAVEVGAEYNQPADRIVIQMESQSGIVAVVAGAAVDGSDPESMESLVNRYHLYLRKPATSANVYQYRQWALSVEGVGDALIQPLADGPGTVGIVLADTALLPVDAAVVARCKEYIDNQRPADAADLLVSSAVGITVNVSAVARLSASTTKAAAAAELTQRLADYCRDEVALKAGALPYAKAGYLLMGIPGVEDYSELKLNGAAANVALAVGQVPVIGTVALT